MGRYYRNAYIFSDKGKIDEAIREYENVLKNNPDDKEALLALGACYFVKGDKEKASLAYERLYAMDPDSEEITLKLESIYKLLGDKGKIVHLSERMHARNPENTIIAFKLANLYREAGERDKALPIYEELVKVNPKHTISLFNIGIIHYEKGDKERAIQLFEEILKINPRHGDALSNLGVIRYELGDKEEAIRLLVKASESGNLNAKMILGQLGHASSNKQRDTIGIHEVDVKPKIMVKSQPVDVQSKEGVAELKKSVDRTFAQCTMLKRYLEEKVFRVNQSGRVVLMIYFTKEGKVEATLIARFLDEEALAEVQKEFSALLAKREITIIPALHQNRAVTTRGFSMAFGFELEKGKGV